MRESSIWAVTWPGTEPGDRGEDGDGNDGIFEENLKCLLSRGMLFFGKIGRVVVESGKFSG